MRSVMVFMINFPNKTFGPARRFCWSECLEIVVFLATQSVFFLANLRTPSFKTEL